MTPQDIAPDGDGDSQERLCIDTCSISLPRKAPTSRHSFGSAVLGRRTEYDDEVFVTKLHQRLDFLVTVIQKVRHQKYGYDVAEEWPMGHTPTEFVELSRAEAERQLALFEASSSDDDSVDDGDGARAIVDPLEGPAAPAIANLSPRLPTPSPSTPETPDSRGVILPGDHPSVAAPDITVSKATQGRKRRRDAHAEEEVEGRPAKIRKTAADARRRRRTRQRHTPSS
ncbi:hypothetical protein B0T18DRAFT_385833 [Schizothecium vesticola]|uniref:Uncharacterized protein n=1 Tax=Schizothecium vesticola TaxID=314040 RepID=A0AA40KCL7_9PEZI|nr:hypothetical protein B0T18DRAFT_385833 [Schizothecium vesticola]